MKVEIITFENTEECEADTAKNINEFLASIGSANVSHILQSSAAGVKYQALHFSTTISIFYEETPKT